MVRPRALADVANQETIRRYCERYPNMRLILAHAARGFNPHHTMLGINSLARAAECLVRHLGRHRFRRDRGDHPDARATSACCTVPTSPSHTSAAGAWRWATVSSGSRPTTRNLDVPYAKLELALVGHESLRTLKVAAMSLRLTDSQVEDIFHGNAIAPVRSR